MYAFMPGRGFLAGQKGVFVQKHFEISPFASMCTI